MMKISLILVLLLFSMGCIKERAESITPTPSITPSQVSVTTSPDQQKTETTLGLIQRVRQNVAKNFPRSIFEDVSFTDITYLSTSTIDQSLFMEMSSLNETDEKVKVYIFKMTSKEAAKLLLNETTNFFGALGVRPEITEKKTRYRFSIERLTEYCFVEDDEFVRVDIFVKEQEDEIIQSLIE